MLYSAFHKKWESGYGSYLNCYCLDHIKIYNKVTEDCVLKKTYKFNMFVTVHPL